MEITSARPLDVTGLLNDEQKAALDALLRQITPQQALWISGYIAGLHASEKKAPQSRDRATTITILYASETGNARGLAEQFAERLSARGFTAVAVGMDAYPSRQLKDESCLIVIASTHGEGEPPNHAKDFYEFLHGRKAPRLEKLKYAVLGLGDSSYEFFCQAAKDFDKRLAELGAQRLHPRADCDIDYDLESRAWLEAVTPSLEEFLPGAGAPAKAPDVVALNTVPRSIFSKKNPFAAPLVENIVLNGRGSGKETRHLEFLLEDSGILYQPGDALGVHVRNPEGVVGRLCAALGFDETARVVYQDREQTLRQCLAEQAEITTVTGKFLARWAEWSGADDLRAVIGDPAATHEFCAHHHIEDLAARYPARGLAAGEFVQALRPLQPRLYSIASCLEACPGEAHLTVSLLRYTLNGRECAGVASGYLASRAVETKVPVYVQHNPNFKLPADPDTPVIMIGAGTGVAPYRGFLQSMRASGRKRRGWLFFGDRRFRTDFLYQAEWQRYLKERWLTRMDVAFSRDQAEKVYVQHKMWEQARDLYAWLEDGAAVYVCGDANRMAQDVHAALRGAVMSGRGCGADAAEEYLKALRQNKRYQQDVY